jgi:hypothetical protein
LRGQNLLVEAERRFNLGSGSIQIDGYLFRDTDAIAIEAELEPALSVRADAQSRLGKTLDGKAVNLAVALIYPDRLRQVPDAQLEAELASAQDIRFSVGELRETNTLLFDDPRNVRWTFETKGSVRDLADLLWDKWTESSSDKDELNELVSILDSHINLAAEVLYQSEGARRRVIDELQLNALGLEEHAATRAAALILVNAMVFHELLSRHIPEIPPPTRRQSARDHLAPDGTCQQAASRLQAVPRKTFEYAHLKN